jgi:hypothetical protein
VEADVTRWRRPDGSFRLGGRPFRRLRAGVVATALAAALTSTVASTAPAQAASGSGDPSVQAGESAALKQARSTDEPVEVASLRGETREVYAQPDGTFEAVEHLRPVRTRQGGKWVDIDTTLHKHDDGTVSPAASTVDLTFSGGGTGPMVTMVKAGRKLSFSWPGSLPAPELSGATATYKDVIDGVDLQLNADTDGFSDLLIVKTREAAQDPKLAQLKFTTSATGVSLAEDEAGGLKATDAGGGGVVFEAPQPMMWDSATGTAAAKATKSMAAAAGDLADGDEGSSHRAPIDVQVASNAVTLTPDQTMLADPATTFPVYIDPVYKTVKDSAWLMVSSGGWKDYDFSGDEGMGYCPYDYTTSCGSPHVKRLFYRMPTSGFGGKTILSAEFQVRETFAPSCETRTVQLWKTKAFGTSSTWDSTKDNWLEHLDSQDTAKGYSGCPAGDVILDATQGMKEAAAGGWSTLTLGLKAATEDSQLAWKRFADDAYLRVHYNTPPPQPKMTNLTSSPGGACKGPSSPAKVNVPPKAYAVLTDPDTEDAGKVRGQFQAAWDDGTGWAQRWTSDLTSAKASGSTFTMTLPSTIPENTVIEWHVRAYDGTSYSPWSYAGNATGCYFLYDHTVPAAPTITSDATDGYPESNPDDENDPWYDGVGRYGKFTLTPADSDVTRYQWGVNEDPSSAHETVTTAGAPVTIDVMPQTAGPNYLSVKAIDASGNASATATYYFRVKAGADAKATYALDEPIDSTQVKDTGGGNPADVHGGVTLGVDGITKTGMELNGTDGYAATTAPLLDTTKSFAVSAWARLTATKPDHAGIIATQAGAQKSGFELYYSSALDRWAFNRYASDTADATIVRATPSTAPQGGEWTHLLGVYDAVAQTLSLYVNGTLAQTVAYTTPWNATGGLQIGAGSYGAVPGSFFSGDVDDVRFFDRVVTAQEARVLFTQRPVVGARWKLNEAAAAVRPATAYWKLDEAAGAARAEDTMGTYPAGAHGGVTFGATGKAGNAVQLNGSTGYLATSGPVVDTTKSFSVSAWAKMTAKSATPVVVSQEGSEGSAFALYYSSNYDRWIFNMQTPDTDTPTYIRAQSTQPPTLNTWTHLAGVYDADTQQIRLYVDGKLQQTVDQPNTWASTGPLDLGRFKSKGAYTSYFNGSLDDVRVFDQPINDSEAAQLAGGAPTSVITSADDTAYGHHVTLFGNAFVDQGAGWIGSPPGGLVLDGDGDYAATTGPVVRTDQSFTVAGWVETAGRPTRDAAVFSQEGDVNSGFTLRYHPDSTDPAAGGYQIDMPDKDATGATHQVAENRSFQADGSGWDHVAIVYDAFADEMRLYVNGNLMETDDGIVSFRENTLAFNAVQPFQIGRSKTDGAYGEYWPGVIDDVWAFNGVLSDDQIAKLSGGLEYPTNDL